MKKITSEEFTKRFGREPVMDDLNRVNCPEAGDPGHYQCGVCEEHDKPRFMCGCPHKNMFITNPFIDKSRSQL
jgi:hypothetical protein